MRGNRRPTVENQRREAVSRLWRARVALEPGRGTTKGWVEGGVLYVLTYVLVLVRAIVL